MWVDSCYLGFDQFLKKWVKFVDNKTANICSLVSFIKISEFPRTGPIFKNQENTMTWGFPTFTLSAYPQPSRIQRSSGKCARWITWSISCKYLIKKQVAGQEEFTLTHLDIAAKKMYKTIAACLVVKQLWVLEHAWFRSVCMRQSYHSFT